MVASEVHPFAKTGGLADVLGALPRALVKLGHHVDVVLPRYRAVNAGSSNGQITVTLGGQIDVVDVSSVVADGVRVVFVSHPASFDREYLYGAPSRDYPDNPERFAVLSQAALAWAATAGQPYDIVHAHDWQTGLVPYLATRRCRHGRAPGPATIFTIHNLAYQGVFDASWLPRLGFGWDGTDACGCPRVLEPDQLPQGRNRLRGDRDDREPSLHRGNPDARAWVRIRRDPSRQLARSRRHSKRDRLRSLGAGTRPEPSRALRRVKDDRKSRGQAKGSRSVGWSSRRGSISWIRSRMRCRRCGRPSSCSEPASHGSKPGGGISPSGIPAHATGGLSHTVHDADDSGRGTGFTFVDYSPAALLGALGRALDIFENRQMWRRIQKAGMGEDFSWDASAREYVKVYERATTAYRAAVM